MSDLDDIFEQAQAEKGIAPGTTSLSDLIPKDNSQALPPGVIKQGKWTMRENPAPPPPPDFMDRFHQQVAGGALGMGGGYKFSGGMTTSKWTGPTSKWPGGLINSMIKSGMTTYSDRLAPLGSPVAISPPPEKLPGPFQSLGVKKKKKNTPSSPWDM